MFNEDPSIRWPVKPKGIALGAGLAAAMIFLYNFNPAGTSFYPTCPFNTLSGLYCPGCGSLRALHQLSHGHLFAALALNPLMVMALPFIVYGLISEAMFSGRRRILPAVFVPPAWIWLLFGVIVIYWVARNIPAYPFLLLAPH